jgi:ubiquitin-conjugating enzyme E2 O
MLHLLRRPPQEFEGFVKDHFRRRGRLVLTTCETYLKGCVDETVLGDDNATVVSRERPCSVGFKLALANVIPTLVAAFIEIGAEGCQEFQEMRVSLPRSLSTTQ